MTKKTLAEQNAERKATRRPRGRPKNKELAKARKQKNRKGKNTLQIIEDYKTRMVASPKSEAVLQKVFDAALDDEHKHQAACMKMVMDRVAPLSYFEKDKLSSGGTGINITISGLGAEISPAKPDSEIVEDGEYSEVDGGSDED